MKLRSISTRKHRLLRWEIRNIQRYLDSFEAAGQGRRRQVSLGSTDEFLIVRNLPLPDGCRPDYVDALIVIDNYPGVPPIGLYVLTTAKNRAVVETLAAAYNVFRDSAYHEAPRIEGYTWICYHYDDNRWRFNAAAPHKGDNIAKFLASFYADYERKS